MNAPFFAWPGWRFLGFAWLLSALHGAWFMLIYGGCDWLTANRQFRVRLDMPWEQVIPFVPGMVVFYASINIVFLLGPFILRQRAAFARTIMALALCTFLGGVGFLLFPAVPMYPPYGDLGPWKALFQSSDALNLTYNLAPSLHVALSVACIAAYAENASRPVRFLLWLWAVAIALSTLLTHQHHVVDVISGWLVALLARSWAARCFLRWQRVHLRSRSSRLLSFN